MAGYAQAGNIQLIVQSLDSAAKGYKLRPAFADIAQLKSYLENLPTELLSKGYLSASIDSVALDSPVTKINLFLGQRFQWGYFELPDEFKPVQQEWGLPVNPGKKKYFINPATDFRNRVLDYLEEKGYPFASVSFDSVRFNGEYLTGKMLINKGVYYKIDSIAQEGSLRLNPRFINRYLGLLPGAPYQPSKLKKIAQRLDELPFAQQQQPWRLNMLGTGGVVSIYLEQKRSNILNVLLGVMPASTQTPGNKLLLTGDANILLRNSFRSGETIAVNWQQIQYQSPRLNLLYQQPYIFGSKAGVDFYFDLFKKDTQFVNLQVRFGVPYEFSLSQSAKVFFLHQQTNVSTVDTNFVLQSGQLPDLAATSATSLGFDYTINTTNYRLNPRYGNELNISIIGGTKRLKASSDIENLKDPNNPGFNFGSLYDSIALKTYQFRIKMGAAKYFPTGKASVLKLAATAGWYQSGNYFRNELFQIGGFRLLRGFDEESIFARNYAVLTTEYRLLSGKSSYFFGFMDAGYAQYKDQLQQFGHTYIGSGIGMVLETKNSLINISWAIGKRNDLPLDLRQSKIHLGLINFF